MADSAPTRRSSRTSATPVQATTEVAAPSRAATRRQTAGVSTERPAVVWGRAGDGVTVEKVAVEKVAVEKIPGDKKHADAVAEAPSSVPAPSETAVAPAPAIIELSEPVIIADSLPMSRRARRSAAAARPVAIPPIAVDAPTPGERRAPEFEADLPTPEAPAPMLQSVLAPAEPFELIEPVAAEPVEPIESSEQEPLEPATEPETEPSASGIDEFEAAARLFSFTGETPVQAPAADEAPAEPAPDARSSDHVPGRRTKVERGASFRKVATASFSLGVVGVVGLMTVGMTTPAEAVAAVSGADTSMTVLAPADRMATDIDEDEIQAYVAPSTVLNDTLERSESYGTITMAELASEAGIQNFSNLFHNDPNSNIQWPFAVGVTMSYGYGMRSGRLHEGIDFTPGAGSPIQAIADGTVRVASEAGGAFGVHVIIDHMVDGELVSSHYAHMQYGSLQVEPGQSVTVGTVLGRTGNTGRSYGAHTHFEILQNGTTAIDPMPWLRAHTDGTHTVG